MGWFSSVVSNASKLCPLLEWQTRKLSGARRMLCVFVGVGVRGEGRRPTVEGEVRVAVGVLATAGRSADCHKSKAMMLLVNITSHFVLGSAVIINLKVIAGTFSVEAIGPAKNEHQFKFPPFHTYVFWPPHTWRAVRCGAGRGQCLPCCMFGATSIDCTALISVCCQCTHLLVSLYVPERCCCCWWMGLGKRMAHTWAAFSHSHSLTLPYMSASCWTAPIRPLFVVVISLADDTHSHLTSSHPHTPQFGPAVPASGQLDHRTSNLVTDDLNRSIRKPFHQPEFNKSSK